MTWGLQAPVLDGRSATVFGVNRFFPYEPSFVPFRGTTT